MKISSVFKKGLQRPTLCSHFGEFFLSFAAIPPLLLEQRFSSRAGSGSRLSFWCPFFELMHWFCRQKIDLFSITQAKGLSAGWMDLLYITDRRWGLMQMQFYTRMQHPVPSSTAASCARCCPRKGDIYAGRKFYILFTSFFFPNESAERVEIPWFWQLWHGKPLKYLPI